jgi:hypothetical protein
VGNSNRTTRTVRVLSPAVEENALQAARQAASNTRASGDSMNATIAAALAAYTLWGGRDPLTQSEITAAPSTMLFPGGSSSAASTGSGSSFSVVPVVAAVIAIVVVVAIILAIIHRKYRAITLVGDSQRLVMPDGRSGPAVPVAPPRNRTGHAANAMFQESNMGPALYEQPVAFNPNYVSPVVVTSTYDNPASARAQGSLKRNLSEDQVCGLFPLRYFP